MLVTFHIESCLYKRNAVHYTVRKRKTWSNHRPTGSEPMFIYRGSLGLDRKSQSTVESMQDHRLPVLKNADTRVQKIFKSDQLPRFARALGYY